MGVSAQIVHMGCSDLIAEDEGRLWRIQVKTSQLKSHGKSGWDYCYHVCRGGKKIPLTTDDCDIVALVAYDLERVLFIPVTCVKNKITKRLKPKAFSDEDLAYKSWQRCMIHYAD